MRLENYPASVKDGLAASQSVLPRSVFRLKDVRRFAAELEVPFSRSSIEWRIMNISADGSRGKIAPYADPRAYTDRLNEIFTPAGWTRRYSVATSSSFERGQDKKLAAKVFVTCDLTIHGMGFHSATGEEWTDNDNAGTSAEAQAFKRACACFGLGRYFYYFDEVWVDIDERQRLKETPVLFAWATPEGWREGLRPNQRVEVAPKKARVPATVKRSTSRSKQPISGKNAQLIEQIEAMAEPLGRRLYRGLLKDMANVWKPTDVENHSLLNKVLSEMRLAEGELGKLKAAQEKIDSKELKLILFNLGIESMDRIDSLDLLRRLVRAVEEKSATA